MSEETKRDIKGRSFEERVLAEFVTLSARLTTFENKVDTRFNGFELRLTVLEDKVDARLRETRPIWEGMQADLREVKGTVISTKAQLGEVARDLLEMRGRIVMLEDRDRRPIA